MRFNATARDKESLLSNDGARNLAQYIGGLCNLFYIDIGHVKTKNHSL